MKVYILVQGTSDTNDTFIQGVFKSKDMAIDRIQDIVYEEGTDDVSIDDITNEFDEHNSYENGYDLFTIKECEVEE